MAINNRAKTGTLNIVKLKRREEQKGKTRIKYKDNISTTGQGWSYEMEFLHLLGVFLVCSAFGIFCDPLS